MPWKPENCVYYLQPSHMDVCSCEQCDRKRGILVCEHGKWLCRRCASMPAIDFSTDERRSRGNVFGAMDETKPQRDGQYGTKGT